MPTLAEENNVSNYAIYDLEFVAPAILKATLARKGLSINPSMDPGDETFNLSAVLGNKDGEFEWGSGGFEQSARSVEVKVRGTRRVFCAELQDKTGGFKAREFDLDEKFELVEYVHPLKKEPYYRLGMKQPPPPQRTLILCFDGTSNHFSNRNTNVVKFMELLKKTDPGRQMVYYQTGVGTYAPPGLVTDAGLALAKKADEGVAWFLYQHVIDGYKFLVETYQIGDRISIFGFSRGAFTARALAGMVHCVGLLPRHNIEHIPFAYEVYKNADDKPKAASDPGVTYGALSAPSPVVSTSKNPFARLPSEPNTNGTNGASETNGTTPAPVSDPAGFDGLDLTSSSKAKNVNPEDFKEVFCIPAAIDFVGVWDTVASVGSLWPKTLPWISYNPSIRNFRQALALDEHRANFIPSVWDHSRTNLDTQNVQEVWFKGGHTDVGGGAPIPTRSTSTPSAKPPGPQSTLSNIALRWMVRQCLELNTGIIFDHRALAKYRVARVLENRPSRVDKTAVEFEQALLNASRELDQEDIGWNAYDAMKGNVGWNILEWAPTSKPVQTERGMSTTRVPNFSKPRSVYKPPQHITITTASSPDAVQSQCPVAIHSSVVDFLDSQLEGKGKYVPRATWSGYANGEYPWIEDSIEGSLEWNEDAKKGMVVAMDWRPKETWGTWIGKKFGLGTS